MTTIPTSYTIRALNRWLASLKLESDSPTIRALHAAVDELDDAPNDLIADAEALLLAATSITVLAFDALEHAAGEIGLEVDEEERAEVKESATLMRGIADLLGEIRERRAEDAMVEGEPFSPPAEVSDDADDWDDDAGGAHYEPFLVAASTDVPMDMATFMRTRSMVDELTCRDAALRFFSDRFNELSAAKTVYIWAQAAGHHGDTVPLMSYEVTFTEKPADMTVGLVKSMLRPSARKVCDVEIVDEVDHALAPGSIQSVQDFLISHGLGDVGVEQPSAPDEGAT